MNNELPDVWEVLFDWDVVNPGFELRVKKLLPLVAHMEDQRTTEEEMLETETGSHAPEVEQISVKDIKIRSLLLEHLL